MDYDQILSMFFIIGFIIWLWLYLKIKDLPPGPWGIPILGILPWINKNVPYRSLTNYAKEYGRIYSISMGSVFTVVISDPVLIREALSKDVFTARANLYLTHGMMEGYGLIASEGERWKTNRKFIGTFLKNQGQVKIGSKRAILEDKILKYMLEDTNKKPIDPLNIFLHCVGNVMNSIVFGKTWDYDDKEWQWLQHLAIEGVKHIGVAGAINFLPFLRKVQEELDQIGEPSLEIINFTPYTMACLAETQRIRPVVPLGIPHGTWQDTELAGFKIPKGTMIIILQWAVHMDPNAWSQPEKFIPERFLDTNGTFIKNNDYLIPFQSGKRVCIGEEMARMLMFLFGATVLKKFNISVEEKDAALEEALEGHCGITLCPGPHKLIFTPRA